MVIELPSDDDLSHDDDSVFEGRNDLYEAYWLYVDGVRYTGAALDQSEATAEEKDRSPLARHYNHFYEKKEAYKEKCLDLPGNLPKYKEHFQEPRADVRQLPHEAFDDLGINWAEGDDPIWLSPEYELPPVWENDLEHMDRAELRERVNSLREENRGLRDDRDSLREQLERVSRSLSIYLDNQQFDGKSQDDRTSESPPNSSPNSCEKCGKTFDSKAAKNGHKAHCDGSKTGTEPNELEQLAKELPEVCEQQSTTSHEALSAKEELENLNHLLNHTL